MSERTRRYVELLAVALIAAAFSAAAPAIAHGVRHALFAHKAGDAQKLGGKPAGSYALKRTLSTPGALNNAGNPVDWTKLKGVPGGFADGSDNIGPGVADDLDCAACVSEAELAFAVATQAELAALQDRVEELEDKLAAVTYDAGADLLRVSGANLQIVSGSGDTGGATNGLGNLIIGYNNASGADIQTGSHNLVIGDDHTYSSFGGIVAGVNNAITAPHASVTGGAGNTAGGGSSSVTGGSFNTAGGELSSVTGGRNNRASVHYSSVTGGFDNRATGENASVTGGRANTAGGEEASVTGGHFNVASGLRSVVSGGLQNVADATEEWVSGTLFFRTGTVAVPGAGNVEGNGSYNSAVATALCAVDELFIGGGASWDIDADDKELNVVYPRIVVSAGQVGWRVRGGNDTDQNHTLTAQALCLGS